MMMTSKNGDGPKRRHILRFYFARFLTSLWMFPYRPLFQGQKILKMGTNSFLLKKKQKGRREKCTKNKMGIGIYKRSFFYQRPGSGRNNSIFCSENQFELFGKICLKIFFEQETGNGMNNSISCLDNSIP